MPERDDLSWGRYAGIGMEILAGVALGLLIGRWLDRRFGIEPWGIVVGSILGLAAGMYLLFKQLLSMNKE